jgi:hypothetical protein
MARLIPDAFPGHPAIDWCEGLTNAIHEGCLPHAGVFHRFRRGRYVAYIWIDDAVYLSNWCIEGDRNRTIQRAASIGDALDLLAAESSTGMNETPREKWAGYFGLVMVIMPAMIASDFMPAWNVLPFGCWLGIASAGAGLAAAIATPHWGRGAIAGAIAGAGGLLGVWLYVTVRAALTGNGNFLKLEVLVGLILGALPGLVLYIFWAWPSSGDSVIPQSQSREDEPADSGQTSDSPPVR